MDSKFTIIAQTAQGQTVSDGSIGGHQTAFHINSALGMLTMARQNQTGYQHAGTVLDILNDDMQTNINTTKQLDSCLLESIENIEDYLSEGDSSTEIDMAVLVIQDQMGLHITNRNFQLLQYRDNELITHASHTPAWTLGGDKPLPSTIDSCSIENNDWLILGNKIHLELLGDGFIRLTLQRFQDNPPMLVRQFNSRLLHQGGQGKVEMILTRVKPVKASSSGWLGKLSGG